MPSHRKRKAFTVHADNPRLHAKRIALGTEISRAKAPLQQERAAAIGVDAPPDAVPEKALDEVGRAFERRDRVAESAAGRWSPLAAGYAKGVLERVGGSGAAEFECAGVEGFGGAGAGEGGC